MGGAGGVGWGCARGEERQFWCRYVILKIEMTWRCTVDVGGEAWLPWRAERWTEDCSVINSITVGSFHENPTG